MRETGAPWGIICKKTYLTVRDLRGNGRRLDTACVVFNSKVVTCYLALTSGRLGHNRPEVLVRELLDVPLPEGDVDLASLKSFEDLDVVALAAHLDVSEP